MNKPSQTGRSSKHKGVWSHLRLVWIAYVILHLAKWWTCVPADVGENISEVLSQCEHSACWYLFQLCLQRTSKSSLVHMLCQGGQEFTEPRILGQIVLGNVTQREGGENWEEGQTIQLTFLHRHNYLHIQEIHKNTTFFYIHFLISYYFIFNSKTDECSWQFNGRVTLLSSI